MFVEVHMIQNFAPSNLNRDDTNNPKDCEFGGVRRARLSSQCIKRAIRLAPVFAQTTGVEIGVRTKYLVDQLKQELVQAGKSEEETLQVLLEFVPAYASKLEKDNGKTVVLLYVSRAEMAAIARGLLDAWDDKGARDKLVKDLVKAHKNQTSAPDIALFGRMLAEQPELNLEAACQVAHAISTHRVAMEMDFYTAVDQLQQRDESGAAMMGFTGFDSPCYYRYARIDWDKLVENLNGDTELARRTVEGFLRAAVEAVPTGKQNAFAANNPPSVLLAAVREDGMAWSLANAFEKPVRPSNDAGLVDASIAALDAYWGQLSRAYGTGALVRTAAIALDPDAPLENLKDARVDNLEAWLGAVTGALPG